MTDFLSDKQLAEMLGVTTRTTLRWRRDGEGPQYVRAGLKHVLYRRSDVLAWLDAARMIREAKLIETEMETLRRVIEASIEAGRLHHRRMRGR